MWDLCVPNRLWQPALKVLAALATHPEAGAVLLETLPAVAATLQAQATGRSLAATYCLEALSVMLPHAVVASTVQSQVRVLGLVVT